MMVTPSHFAVIQAFLPALFLLAGALLCGLGMAVRRSVPVVYLGISLAASLASFIASLFALHAISQYPGVYGFSDGLIYDRFSVFVSILAAAFSAVLSVAGHAAWRELHTRVPAFYALLLLSASAVSLLGDQGETAMLLTLLALLAISLSGIAALRKSDAASVASAFRQLLFFAVGLAFLAQGLALIYGLTGVTALAQPVYNGNSPAYALAAGFITIGVAAFAGAVPFHSWLTRDGEAHPAGLEIGLIGFALTGAGVVLIRLSAGVLSPAWHTWSGVASLLCAAALLIPAALAVRETNLRRVIALLASFQAALLLLGIVDSGTGRDLRDSGGLTASLFLLCAFLFALCASLLAVAAMESSGHRADESELHGFAHRNPGLAMTLVLGLGGLCGFPPFAGFIGRMMMVQSTVASGYVLVAAAVVIGFFLFLVPFLRVVGTMLAGEKEERSQVAGASLTVRSLAVVCAIAGIGLTFLAQPLLLGAASATQHLH